MINKDIESHGKQAKGKQELIDFNNGKKLTRKQSMLAKCYECCNGYADGRTDCLVTSCPLHGYMNYNPNKTKTGRTMTDEQKQKANERLKKLHEKNKS